MTTRTVAVLVGLSVLLCGADLDNDVEWNGITHLADFDRAPRCPLDGESFIIRFQSWHYDLTSARVNVDDGTETWVDAFFVEQQGAYDVWQATLPATASDTLSYYLELTDGTDTDYFGPDGMSDNPPATAWVLDFSTLSHAPLGATVHPDGGTIFKVWAPSRSSAYVRGDFNGWGLSNPMTKIGEHFVAYVPAADAREQYKYYFNPGGIWKPDARARALNPIVNYNTYIEDPDGYAWGDQAYTTPAFEDMVIYELHVGTFAGRNDPIASGAIPATYLDVAAHVDHLVELGVTAVEVTPITEFPWDFSAGYNPITAWAPEWKYGTPDDLKYMIDVLHQHGIAIIFDIVWNHFSGSDNYLWQYDGSQIYFDTPAVDTPWGSQADFDEPEVRRYFLDSAAYWIEEFHADGFRMDATAFMAIYQGSGWSLMQEFNDLIDARCATCISIAEQLPDDSWITRPTSLGGAGFDSQWHDAFTDRLREEILDAGWDQSAVEIWKIRDILDGSGTYLHDTYVVNYLELHDEAWESSGGQRLVKTIDTTFPHDDVWAKGRIKLGQGIVVTAPGIPAILQGSEWLEDTNFGGGSPSGDDRIDWSHKTTYAPIFLYFKDLFRIRRENPALRSNAGHSIIHENESGNVLAWQRYDDSGNVLVIVANFNNINFTNYLMNFPQAGTWYEILNSQALEYDGNGWGNGGQVTTSGSNHQVALTIPQMGLLVFRWNVGPGLVGDANCDGVVDFKDINPFVNILTGIEPCSFYNADINGDGAIDFKDINPFVQVLAGAYRE